MIHNRVEICVICLDVPFIALIMPKYVGVFTVKCVTIMSGNVYLVCILYDLFYNMCYYYIHVIWDVHCVSCWPHQINACRKFADRELQCVFSLRVVFDCYFQPRGRPRWARTGTQAV